MSNLKVFPSFIPISPCILPFSKMAFNISVTLRCTKLHISWPLLIVSYAFVSPNHVLNVKESNKNIFKCIVIVSYHKIKDGNLMKYSILHISTPISAVIVPKLPLF